MYVFFCVILTESSRNFKYHLQGRTRRAELGLLVRCHLSLPIQAASAATQFSLLRYEWTPDIPVDTERRKSRPHRDLNSCHLVQRGVCYAYSRTGDYHEYTIRVSRFPGILIKNTIFPLHSYPLWVGGG